MPPRSTRGGCTSRTERRKRSLGASGCPRDLSQPDMAELREQLPAEQVRVIGEARVGFFPFPQRPLAVIAWPRRPRVSAVCRGLSCLVHERRLSASRIGRGR
jgi:hypothetical protein